MNSTTNNKTVNAANNDPKKIKQESVVSKSKGKVGEWVRHTSSSGKEYYFNVTSHASQWEKPKEWLDYEKRHGLVPSGAGTPVKSESKPQQNQQQPQQNHQQLQQQPQQQSSSVSSAAAQQQQQQQPQVMTSTPMPEKNHHNNSPYSSSVYFNQSRDQQQRYMDHRFPSSSTSNFNQSVNNVQVHSSTSHHGTPSSSASSSNFTSSVLRLQQLDGNHQQYNRHSVSSSVTSSDHGSNLSVVNYHGNSNHRLHPENFRHSTSSLGVRDSRKPSEDMQTEDMDISPLDSNSSPHNSQESNKTPNSRGGGGTSNRNDRNTNHSNEGSNCYQRVNNYTRERYRDRDTRESPRNHRDSNNRSRARERNNRDVQRERSRSRLRDEREPSPWDNDHTPERRDGEITGNLGSLASLSTLNSGESELPSLSASLALYYRDDLIEHVKNLPGEAMERQANKVNDDVLTQAAISLSKVSTELKMARSMVRLTDIQSTLKEQRILFLRQQMIKLEQTDHSALMGLGNDE